MKSRFFLLLSLPFLLHSASLTSPIVQTSDPSYVSHKISVKNVTIGLNNKGGGYLNYCSINGSENIVSTDFGKGWQGAIRDRLHRGRYNPTQAGFSDSAGAPVEISIDNKRVTIRKFNMPLFGDAVFDFTEHEDLVPDSQKYKDKGNTDADGLSERLSTQDDEIRSEFDFQGYYEDASYLVKSEIPIIRFYSEYIYARTPKSIYQFGENALNTSNQSVLVPKAKLKDISRLLAGKQTPNDTDLSQILFVPYGIRILKKSGYTVPMWFKNGKWNYSSMKELKGKKKKKAFSLNIKNKYKSNFLILASGKNPNRDPAIAMYIPESEINIYQSIGINKLTNRIEYKEDRRMKGSMFFTHRIPKQLTMRYIYFLTGILAPNHTNSNINEGIRNETYILFGTPNKILKHIRLLDEL